jgi:alpha-acetolactate decarboxylase
MKKGVKTMMAAEKTREVERQQADVKEFVELLKKLTAEEKRDVKGIMIGMQIMRDQLKVKTA